MDPLPLVLASGSPRRRALLEGLGLRFEVLVPDVDESVVPGETAPDHVRRLAKAKSEAAARLLAGRPGPLLVLTADTTVAIDGEILGKPRDDAEALAMLRRLAGRTHEVFTACHLLSTGGAGALSVVRSAVTFGPWDPDLARWYVATGEPKDKAGAYALQGAGALLTAGIEGSWTNVVGLPVEALPGLFREAGDELARRLVEGAADGC
jgi:septum formation protein